MNPEDQSPGANGSPNSSGAGPSRQCRWLIALSVGVVIVFAGAAILPPGKMTPAATCREKLHQLDEAATEWGGDKPWNQRATASDLQPYFRGGKLPVCESGGIYTFGAHMLSSRCSVHGHDQMEPQPPGASADINQFLNDLFGPKVKLSRNSCISNLKQIDGAIQQWALENHKRAEDSITDLQGVATYLKGGEFPRCPQGGKYDATTVGANPTCTVHGHSL